MLRRYSPSRVLISFALLGCGAAVDDPGPAEAVCGDRQGKSWAVDTGAIVPTAAAVGTQGHVAYAVHDPFSSDAAPRSLLGRLEPNGEASWQVLAPGHLVALAATEGDTTVAFGSLPNAFPSEAWLGEFGAGGELLWSQSFAADGVGLSGSHVAVDAAGIWVAGRQVRIEGSFNPTFTTRPFVARIRRDGTLDWLRVFDGRGDVYGLSLILRNGTALLGLRLNPGSELDLPGTHYASERFALVLVALNGIGEPLWSDELLPSNEAFIESVTSAGDGSWYVTGTRLFEGLGAVTTVSAVLSKVGAAGQLWWRREYMLGTQMSNVTLLETECRLVLASQWSGADGTGGVLFDLDGDGATIDQTSWPNVVGMSPPLAQGDGVVLVGQFSGDLTIAGQRFEARPRYHTFVARLAR